MCVVKFAACDSGVAACSTWSIGSTTFSPYSNSNGDLPVDAEIVELIANSMYGMAVSQFVTRCSSSVARSICSMVRCVRSV